MNTTKKTSGIYLSNDGDRRVWPIWIKIVFQTILIILFAWSITWSSRWIYANKINQRETMLILVEFIIANLENIVYIYIYLIYIEF